MRERSIILWVKGEDPPSERAKITAANFSGFLPRSVAFSIREVDRDMPEVTRVPSLVFYAGTQVVYVIEGEINLDSVSNAIKRLS